MERVVKFLACIVENSLRVVRKLEESQEETYLPGKLVHLHIWDRRRSYSYRQPTTFNAFTLTFSMSQKREGLYCGKSGKVSDMYCGKFIARWRQLYTCVSLPLPLTHIGCYHGSIHTDNPPLFFFKSGASHPSLSHIATTAAAALLLLHSHRCRCSAFSSPPSCRYWFFFFTATPSSSPPLLLVLLLFFFFFFFCAIWF